ncbi:hypothetical protein BVRB_3g048580 [Beta vulgaris subsp. vulgaris]|nr:hypothetical protein BVRB_3g048580 [Beta vulgaris subsp. vulgaris]
MGNDDKINRLLFISDSFAELNLFARQSDPNYNFVV